MGSGSVDLQSYRSISTALRGHTTSVHEVYKNTHLDKAFDPANITLRESRDSVEHPLSNAIGIFLDQTGSMKPVIHFLAKEGLADCLEKIHGRMPLTDPQIMFGFIGDAENGEDGALQATQFESDERMDQQLTSLWVVGNGGGNGFETYTLAWLFAGRQTSIDCFEKRGRKGYLFTIGDEPMNPELSQSAFDMVYHGSTNGGPAQGLTPRELYAAAAAKYHVFHLVVKQGTAYESFTRKSFETVMPADHVIELDDVKNVGTLIADTIEANEQALANGGTTIAIPGIGLGTDAAQEDEVVA